MGWVNADRSPNSHNSQGRGGMRDIILATSFGFHRRCRAGVCALQCNGATTIDARGRGVLALYAPGSERRLVSAVEESSLGGI